jgi:zinc protease
VPAAGGEVDAVEAELDAVIADVIADGVTDDELERARNRLIASTVYALDSQYRLAFMFGVALTNERTVEDVLNWTERIEAVTAEDVRQAAEGSAHRALGDRHPAARGAAAPGRDHAPQN